MKIRHEQSWEPDSYNSQLLTAFRRLGVPVSICDLFTSTLEKGRNPQI